MHVIMFYKNVCVKLFIFFKHMNNFPRYWHYKIIFKIIIQKSEVKFKTKGFRGKIIAFCF